MYANSCLTYSFQTNVIFIEIESSNDRQQRADLVVGTTAQWATVLLAVSRRGILGPYFLKSTVGALTVNRVGWGATCHTAINTLCLLWAIFVNGFIPFLFTWSLATWRLYLKSAEVKNFICTFIQQLPSPNYEKLDELEEYNNNLILTCVW